MFCSFWFTELAHLLSESSLIFCYRKSHFVSISIFQLLRYRNKIDFCSLILTLLDSLSSSKFLVDTLIFSTYTIVLSVSKKSMASSFRVWMYFDFILMPICPG